MSHKSGIGLMGMPSCRPERVFEIRDEILDVFNSDGYANQAAGDAEPIALLNRYRGVGHRCGM